jgi:hypothetical protein
MLAVSIAKTNMVTSQTVDVRVILEPFPKLNKLKEIKTLYILLRFTSYRGSIGLIFSFKLLKKPSLTFKNRASYI